MGAEAADPAARLGDEVIVDVVHEGAIAVLEVLNLVDAMPVIEHRAAYGDGRAHALADDPLLVLVFARDGIALVV